jgi:hypothetical protein
MYYSYIEIEYVATSFSPARTDLALKLLICKKIKAPKVEKHSYSKYYFLYSVIIIIFTTIISVKNHCFAKKVILL